MPCLQVTQKNLIQSNKVKVGKFIRAVLNNSSPDPRQIYPLAFDLTTRSQQLINRESKVMYHVK